MSEVVGSFALSLSGRDKKRIFVIVGVTDDGRLLIADGVTHKIDKPKKKNPRHIRLIPGENDELRSSIIAGCATNRMIADAAGRLIV